MDRDAEVYPGNRLGKLARKYNPLRALQGAEIRNPFSTFRWEDVKPLAAAAWASKPVARPLPVLKAIPMVL